MTGNQLFLTGSLQASFKQIAALSYLDIDERDVIFSALLRGGCPFVAQEEITDLKIVPRTRRKLK